MKRVLFLVPSLSVGGMERMLVLYANLFAQNGDDVTVLNFSFDDPAMISELDERVRYRSAYQPVPNLLRWFARGQKEGGFRLLPWKQWIRFHRPAYLYRKYIQEPYDLEIAFYGAYALKILSGYPADRKGTTRLAWVHSDFQMETGYRKGFASRDALLYAYRRMDRVVCVSNRAKESFYKAVGDPGNLAVLYNMLPVEEIRRKAEEPPTVRVPKASFHVVMVARLCDSVKGQSRLIRAVQVLHEKGIDISAALVGGGSDEAMLRALIESLDAGSYLTITGMQSNPYPYLKEADLLVCASHYEGFPLNVAEALIAGTPVLSTDCTGPTEILENGTYGMLVPDDDRAILEGIRSFATDPSLSERYRARAAKRASELDAAHGMERLLSILPKEEERESTEDQHHHSDL